jgi:hypothetical protein
VKNLDIKFIASIFILLILVPASSAETILSSTLELVNGSGSITWNAQNFPALRSGDTIEL